MIWWLILLVLIYLVSFAAHILWMYFEQKRIIHKVGDVIDKIEFFMWFPLINTVLLIFAVVCIFIMKLLELLKLDILWEKFRNIKLK